MSSNKKILVAINIIIDLAKYTFVRLNYKFPKVLSIEKTLDLILQEKKSFSRYGDGEFNLLSSKSIGFQESNKLLSLRLQEVLTSNSKTCLICIPGSLNSLKGMEWKSMLMWMHLIGKFYKNYCSYFNFEYTYPNSLITRPYMDLSNKDRSFTIFEKLKLIWKDKNVIIIEGEHTKLGVGNDLFATTKSIRRLITVSKNSFSKYTEILEEAKYYDIDSVILIALGPTATVLAYDLSELGFQACDVGHIDVEYEWFLKKTKKKTSIDGKFVNEISTDNPTTKLVNNHYENQIIKKIL